MAAKIVPLTHDTYLQVIAGTVGSNMFRTLWAEVDGVKQDITRDGELSCAFFVSSVLKMFTWIKSVHATVAGAVRDLEESGWRPVSEPRPGAVLVWESQVDEVGEEHGHIGFYLGDGVAVSNSSKERTPQRHPHDFRKIIKILCRE